MMFLYHIEGFICIGARSNSSLWNLLDKNDGGKAIELTSYEEINFFFLAVDFFFKYLLVFLPV